MALKEESHWACVTKSSNSCMKSSMYLKMKKNEIEGEYSFESDIFTLNGSKNKKVLLVIILP